MGGVRDAVGAGFRVLFSTGIISAFACLFGLPIIAGIATTLMSSLIVVSMRLAFPVPHEPVGIDNSPQARFARDEMSQLEMEQEIERQLAVGKSGEEQMNLSRGYREIPVYDYEQRYGIKSGKKVLFSHRSTTTDRPFHEMMENEVARRNHSYQQPFNEILRESAKREQGYCKTCAAEKRLH